MSAPLDDITIIEIDNWMAAPSAGAILADLGANVVICLDWNVGFNYLRSRAEAVEGVKVIKIPKSGGVERTGGGGKATASGEKRGDERSGGK